MKKYQNKIISIPNLYRDLMVHFGSKETLRKVLCKYVDEETAANAVDAIGLSNKGCTVIDQQNGVFFVWMPRKPQVRRTSVSSSTSYFMRCLRQ